MTRHAAAPAPPVELPPVLTNEDAVRFLRLDEDHPNMGEAVRALHRLVRDRRLRPLRYAKSYKFTLDELARFIAAEQERGIDDPPANDAGGPVRADPVAHAHLDAHQDRQGPTASARRCAQ
jgi:hypothetical protein